MALDGMATPLGMKPRNSRRGVSSFRKRGMLALIAALLAAVLVGLLIKSSRNTPENTAVAVIERVIETNSAPKVVANPPGNAGQGPRADVAEIEANSGVNVVRQNGGTAPGGVIIKVPDSGSVAADRVASAADPRVAERSAVGILPRIGEGGLMARNVYARAFTNSGKPKIAIVLTGVGIGARGTADAISKLPGEVTLAFAPYGRDLESQVIRARRDGHEILLQVPMEPQDYPDSDPGPHTLRSGQPPRENIEKLHWLMSRFSGYVGLTNFLGAKLMTDQAAYGPLLEEINRRGLLFLEDGTVQRSRTKELAGKLSLPVLVADRIQEAGRSRPLELLLSEVEDLAKRNGSAILSVPALPGNIDKISAWERELAGRGLVLAPVSAIIGRLAR